jgi:multidrug resistance efflux pump
MSAVIDPFEKNDLRKSNRIRIEGTVTLKGKEFSVADWSFDGFRVKKIPFTTELQINQFVDIQFAVHYGAFDINFATKARLIWISGTAAGFEWARLPPHIRSMFKEYLRTRSDIRPTVTTSTQVDSLFLSPTNIEPLHQPELEVSLKKQRRVRISAYYVIAIVVMALLAFLQYENQFTYSERAIYPGNLSVINSTVEGAIQDVFVKQGDKLNKGDIIATIDSSDLEQQITAVQRLVEQRKMAVAVGERAVQYSKEPKSIYASVAERQLAAAKANVAQARAVLKAKENDLNRMTELEKRSLIGRAELDRVKADADSAAAHLQVMQEEKRLAEKVLQEAKLGRFFNGTRVDNDDQVIEVNLAQRQAELAQAELDLARIETLRNHTQIKAMESGRIFALHIEPGKFVKRGDKVGVIDNNMQQPFVVGKFKIDDAKLLNPGTRARVYMRDTDQTIDAKVVSLGHTRLSGDYPLAVLLDSLSSEVPVEFELDHLPDMYYAGMPVDIRVQPAASGFGLFRLSF